MQLSFGYGIFDLIDNLLKNRFSGMRINLNMGWQRVSFQ